MGRLLGLVTHNWPLKIGAIVLAVLLYSGLVLSQNARLWPGRVPIEVANQPASAFLLENLGDVSGIRFYAPADVAARVTNADFRAVVDLGAVVPAEGGAPVAVPVTLTVLDPRIKILDYQPQVVAVRLDPVVSRTVPVAVDHGSVPAGLVIGEPSLGATTVTVRGASSLVAQVQEALARVLIDASGINVDGEVELIAVDARGDEVAPVDISPDRVHVGITVDRVIASRSLPVAPQLTGTPASGFEVTSVTVTPAVVTVLGDASILAGLQVVPTGSLSLAGHNVDFSATVPLAPSQGLSVSGSAQVVVSIHIAAQRGSRTFSVGLSLSGASGDRTYLLSAPQVLITLGGPNAILATLDASTLTASLDVSALSLGPSTVTVQITPPGGLDVVSISPSRITVTVVAGATPPADGDALTMARLFGTDGIRGKANVELTPGLAQALGLAVVRRLHPDGGAIVIGQDTRRSGDMLASALISGATSLGADVHRTGVVPTPALSFITAAGAFDAGIMVSASHNPADDNGLKVLDRQGLKLDDAIEDELEALIRANDGAPGPTNAGLGREVDARDLLDGYRRHRLGIARAVRSGLRIVLDCANGSGGVVAPALLAATGASVEVIFNDPDGMNINLACGATAPAALAERVRASGADLGFALDGDADRCVAVDERGQVVDGDQLIGLLALERLERDALAGRTVVVSVLSNGGLSAAVEAAGGRVERTPVGDKYILDAMLAAGAGLGGEKSGHVIVAEHAICGDGILTALETLRVLAAAGRPISELAARIPLFPQEQRTVPVRHKDRWQADAPLAAAIGDAERELAGHGRLLVRPSGTEAALRFMIEGPDATRIAILADGLAALAAERLN